MNGRRGRAFVFLLLGVLVAGALAGSFATDQSVQRGGGEGTGSGGPATGESDAPPGAGVAPQLVPSSWIESFVVLSFAVGTLACLVAAIAVVWLRGVEGLKRVLVLVSDATGGLVLYVLIVGFLVFLAFGFTGEGIDAIPQGDPNPIAGGAGGDGEGVVSPDRAMPLWVLLGGLLGVVSLGIGLLVSYGNDRDTDDAPASGVDSTPETAPETVTGPGVPTETIEDVPASNGVYRAWRRMADRVDEATDRTLTTEEVAAAAVERGMDRDAVRTLTGLFEEVRYGDRSPNRERERRAESALQAMESASGGDG